jgi:hypothetical protein
MSASWAGPAISRKSQVSQPWRAATALTAGSQRFPTNHFFSGLSRSMPVIFTIRDLWRPRAMRRAGHGATNCSRNNAAA